MNRIAFVTLLVLVVAVVVILSDWGAGANTEKNGRANRLAARKGEYGGERVLNNVREAYLGRVVTGREGLSSDTQLEERRLPLAVRVPGYVFFLAAVLAASMAVGGGIVVGMEYLLGWPETWWL